MLNNGYFVVKIRADTAENETHFADILPKIGNYPTGPSPIAPKATLAPGETRRLTGQCTAGTCGDLELLWCRFLRS